MAEKKIIAVLGATGAQGGGLVRAILNDESKEFSVRALTRNVTSEKAKKLAQLGAEVVQVDIDDHETLKSAFSGAYGVYAVTFFWEHFSAEKEIAEAESIAKAAKETGVKHIIWSTLEDTRKWIPIEDKRMPVLQDKYNVPHFDAKGYANKFFTEQTLPVTLLQTAFYWDNFIYFGLGPKKGHDGNIYLTMPMGDKKLPGISSEDIGKTAFQIFKKGKEYIGKTVSITGGNLTGKELADQFTDITGQKVIYNPVSFEQYRSFGFPGADELGNMFQFKHDMEDSYCGVRDVNFTKSLNPSLKSFREWLTDNKDKVKFE